MENWIRYNPKNRSTFSIKSASIEKPCSERDVSSNIEAVRAGFLRRWWSVVEVVECGGGGGVRRTSEEE